MCAAAMEILMTMMLAVAFANSVAGGGDGLPTEGDLSLTTVACGGVGGGAAPLSDAVAAGLSSLSLLLLPSLCDRCQRSRCVASR